MHLAKCLLLLCLGLGVAEFGSSDENALRECGNIHHLEFRSLPDARAEYSNSNCALTCALGDRILSNNTLNEGLICPMDAFGVCMDGRCLHLPTAYLAEAQRECGNLHKIDFHSSKSFGTGYRNNGCQLRCELNSVVVSENSVNEGYECPTMRTMICRAGQCILPPATTTQAPVNVLSSYNITTVKVNVVEAKLNQIYINLQAGVCLSHELLKPNCEQHWTTHSINQYTKHPEWLYESSLHGPFAEQTYLRVDIFHYLSGLPTTEANRNQLGSVTEMLPALLARHFPVNVTHRIENYEFTENLSIYREEAFEGEVGLRFQVALQSSNQS